MFSPVVGRRKKEKSGGGDGQDIGIERRAGEAAFGGVRSTGGSEVGSVLAERAR
jgi:hypothetical protein